MPAETHTFRERTFECAVCATSVKVLSWDYAPVPTCSSCSSPLEVASRYRGASAGVIGDEIDIKAEHGIPYNPDGTPRRYTSKSHYFRDMRAYGWDNRVTHIGAPGTDKSPHTVSWNTGPPPGYDPRPMCLLSPEEQAARRLLEGTLEELPLN